VPEPLFLLALVRVLDRPPAPRLRHPVAQRRMLDDLGERRRHRVGRRLDQARRAPATNTVSELGQVGQDER
jgi:hypothetical protein